MGACLPPPSPLLLGSHLQTEGHPCVLGPWQTRKGLHLLLEGPPPPQVLITAFTGVFQPLTGAPDSGPLALSPSSMPILAPHAFASPFPPWDLHGPFDLILPTPLKQGCGLVPYWLGKGTKPGRASRRGSAEGVEISKTLVD